ncbi:MAG: MazG nucleotide pyrophosphohydrolase domain-containing protein [Bacillota bacterium]
MELAAIQKLISMFVEEYNLTASTEIRMLDLFSEIGELSKEYLKGSDYGKEAFCRPPKWEEEFGDVLFSLICIANSTGVDMEAVLVSAINKYKSRFAVKGDIGSDN